MALANPNLASSTILQPFDDTTGVMVKPENDLYVKSLSEHAKLQFPHFKQETEKYGLPSNLIFTPVMKPLDLVTDAVYDKAVVVRLPASNRTSIYVPFITPILGHSGRKCEVQIDVARRDPCLLRSTDSHSTPANFCAQQKQVLITAHSTKWTNDDLSMSIKSRFSLEFAPYDVSTRIASFSFSSKLLLMLSSVGYSRSASASNDTSACGMANTLCALLSYRHLERSLPYNYHYRRGFCERE